MRPHILRSAAAVLATAVLAGAAPPAAAQDCIGACYATWHVTGVGIGQTNLDTCLSRCRARGGGGGGGGARWGALAYDPHTNSWGAAYSEPTQGRASGEAIGACKAHNGRQCEAIAVYHDACAAFAIVKGRLAAWVQTGATKAAARAGALARCRPEGGEACTVWAYSCAWDTG